jgi:hypothetical protein
MSKYRDWVVIGKKCGGCGEDTWFAYRGHNRCGCGQYLWVERRTDVSAIDGLRFRYVQGRELPANYPGWLKVTDGGVVGRVISEAQRETLKKGQGCTLGVNDFPDSSTQWRYLTFICLRYRE